MGKGNFSDERHLSLRANFELQRNAAVAEWRHLCAASMKCFYPYLRRVRISPTKPPSVQVRIEDHSCIDFLQLSRGGRLSVCQIFASALISP